MERFLQGAAELGVAGVADLHALRQIIGNSVKLLGAGMTGVAYSHEVFFWAVDRSPFGNVGQSLEVSVSGERIGGTAALIVLPCEHGPGQSFAWEASPGTNSSSPVLMHRDILGVGRNKKSVFVKKSALCLLQRVRKNRHEMNFDRCLPGFHVSTFDPEAHI